MKIASRILGVALTALALTACSQDEPAGNGPGVPGDDGTVTTYVSMSLQLPAGPSAKAPARSNPSGGEEGDGRLPGINNENTIHDISLFIYTDVAGGPGLDAPASTSFVATAHFTREQLDAYKVDGKENTYLLPLRDFDPSGHFRIAVAANTGTLPAYVSNMGALRDYICAQSYTPGNGTKPLSIAGADYFVMSNAYNGAKHRSDDGRIYRPENTLEKPGTKVNPLRAEVTLERLSARIDLLYNQNQVKDGALNYTVSEAPGNGGSARNTARVMLTHVIPVNVMQHPSFLFKRVTSGADINDNTLLVCGDETMVGQIPTNYVIEPRSRLKGNGAAIPADWYGSTAMAGYMQAAAYTDGNRLLDSWCRISDAGTREPGFDEYAILGYADENTQDKEVLSNDILTGLVIRALYRPTRVYTYYEPATGRLDYVENVENGFSGTFWLWRPDALTVTDADCLYFNRYDAAVMYAGSHRGTLTEYPDGICYYNMWIRHANDNTADPGPDRRSPMEYGIVRNNVYRISFTFHGPGNLTPDNPRPTEHMRTVIYVRPWAFHRHPEIIM